MTKLNNSPVSFVGGSSSRSAFDSSSTRARPIPPLRLKPRKHTIHCQEDLGYVRRQLYRNSFDQSSNRIVRRTASLTTSSSSTSRSSIEGGYPRNTIHLPRSRGAKGTAVVNGSRHDGKDDAFHFTGANLVPHGQFKFQTPYPSCSSIADSSSLSPPDLVPDDLPRSATTQEDEDDDPSLIPEHVFLPEL